MRARSLAMAPIKAHRRAIAALLLVVCLPACTSWQVGKTSPEQLFAEDPPDRVRVTRTDGSRMELLAREVRADTLVGTVRGDTLETAIPLAYITKLEVQEEDNTKTILLALTPVWLLLFVLGGMALALK